MKRPKMFVPLAFVVVTLGTGCGGQAATVDTSDAEVCEWGVDASTAYAARSPEALTASVQRIAGGLDGVADPAVRRAAREVSMLVAVAGFMDEQRPQVLSALDRLARACDDAGV